MINQKRKQANSDTAIVNAIINKIDNVEAIYLFGSIVRGNATPRSDYDIAIFVKKYPRNDMELMFNLKKILSNKLKRPMDIIILESRDLEQSPIFLYELYTNHKKLYGSDILKSYESIVKKMNPKKPVDKSGPMWYYA
jgi:predicted nucleotidyltransferase